MTTSLRLERLVKSTKRLSFIGTPGSVGRLAFARKFPSAKKFGDSDFFSQVQSLQYTVIPSCSVPSFTLKAVPMFLLQSPQRPVNLHPSLSRRYVGYQIDPPMPSSWEHMNMSVQFTMSKELRQATIRSRVKNKIKNALGIVMTKEIEKYSLEEEECFTPLEGWTYIFAPSLEVYRLPTTDLIDRVRLSLKKVNEMALAIESSALRSSQAQSWPKEEREELYSPRQTYETSTPTKTKTISISEEATVQKREREESIPNDVRSRYKIPQDDDLPDDELPEEETSGDKVQALLDEGSLMSPQSWSLPAWARPDFKARDEFVVLDSEKTTERALLAFRRRMFRSDPIMGPKLSADEEPEHRPPVVDLSKYLRD